MLDPKLANWIWEVIKVGLLEDDIEKAKAMIAALYDRGLELPSQIETMLLEIWSSGDESALWDLALLSAEKAFFDVRESVLLIALLVCKGKLGIKTAFGLLGFVGFNLNELDPSIRHVIDVVWLLRHDSEAGVMEAEDDTLLAEALERVLNEYRTKDR
ncbi:hypothetical protein [Nitrospira lenta]|uniref:Uncharacterized protein n=1 Tax=Nitrospira lenta TaxID=1436998 RepID=A0A330L1Q0_9BACT|nr:hypothetical protein [Nitrospira lenta]SPP63179.1 hypothetical protein NITLEN_10265 [Nitrospira lenta]